MKQYFESLGWVYSGDCGCRENLRRYVNTNYPKWQIWINSSGDMGLFKKNYGNSQDLTSKGRFGVKNYTEAYDYWILNDRD